MAPAAAAAAQEYQRVLASFLQQRDFVLLHRTSPRSPGPTLRNVVRETVVQLDELDRRRATLWPTRESAP